VFYARRWNMGAFHLVTAGIPAWLVALASLLMTLAISPLLFGEPHEVVVIIGNGCLFGLLFVALMRVVFASHLSELAAVAPAALARPMRILLALKEPRLEGFKS
jgi:hypothetical protein